MLTVELFEELAGPPEPTLIDALRDFLPIAVRHLKLKHLPKIKLLRDVNTEHMASFGKFTNDDRIVHVDIENRHPNDVLRTLAHELTHYAQGKQDRLDADSGRTGSNIEDEANAEAGVIMREFNTKFPQYMQLKPIILPETWTKKYKKSINCSNPKGFSQKAHCAARRARQAGKKTKSKSVSEVKEKPKLYTGEELDLRVHLLSKQLGMSPAEVRRQYTDPMIKDGRIKLVPSKVSEQQLDEKCWPGYHKEGNKKMFGKTYPNCVKNKKSNEGVAEDARIARKPGQPAKSKQHSDLYTDEDPRGTITGLKFATVEDARASVAKIRRSGRSHAHKIQAAVAMEQRAKAAGKTSAAAVYRKYINANRKTK